MKIDNVDATKGEWRTISINIEGGMSLLREFGLLKIIWGTDIWINGFPILKLLIAANFVVWIILFLMR